MLWEKIKSIEFVGYEQVYDISVEGTHNFVANSIVAHNTYISGNVGIGTTGPDNKLTLYGTASNLAGPHIKAVTTADAYPVFQQLNWTHDNISLNFDSYYDGTWRSASSGSNYQIYKIGNLLRFRYASGVAAGSAINWNEGIVLNTAGNVGIGTTGPQAKLHVSTDGSSGTGMSFRGNLEINSGSPQINFNDVDNNDWAIHVNSNKMYFIREPWTYTDLVLDGAGNVGIGTTGPGGKLEVNMGNNNNYFRINSDSNIGLELRSGTTGGTPYIDFSNDPTIDYDVRLRLTGDDILALEGGTHDIAETIIAAESLEPGNIVATGPFLDSEDRSDRRTTVVKTTKPYQSDMLGVIATKPALLLRGFDNEDGDKNLVPLALAGRLLVKVSTI
ncbi:MAG: hypothetical protein ACPL7A_01195, partial [Anaerolineales bacterium]